MPFLRLLALPFALLLAAPAMAQQTMPVPVAPAPSMETPPKLLVVISVDQFSADLFAEYRAQWRFGFARLLQGAVFPSGYQSHAATETCPGHSTILTGDHPSRTGIIANNWVDQSVTRADKTVYCAEDETAPGTDSTHYTVSDAHLRVPTLGEWMKAADPATRVVSVAGKDRAAVMLGGHKVDELWWWDDGAFVSHPGHATPAIVAKVNALVTQRLAETSPPLDLPPFCQSRAHAVPPGAAEAAGDGRFARDAGDKTKFRASPELDEAVLALAGALATDLKLGQGASTDLIAIGASATDFIGHRYGARGSEMCLQLLSLDQSLGKLFAVLDRTGVDYAVVLTADHGGHDIPERGQDQAMPIAERITPALGVGGAGKAIGAELNLPGRLLFGAVDGDIWVQASLSPADKARVLAAAVRYYQAQPQVAGVFMRAQIEATPAPKGPPETWTLLERARASYDRQRSGDLVVALKQHVTPIDSTRGVIATHGSFWDYDRRVPILFWRKGMTGFEQPRPVETVDIAPTLAGLIHLAVKPGQMDGRCLDLDAGAGSTCP